MKEPQKTAAEAEAQGRGGFRLEVESCVVYLKLLQCILYVLVLLSLCRVDAAVNHGLDLLVARKHLLCRIVIQRDGVAHSGVGYLLDAAADIAYLSGSQYVSRHGIRRTDTHLGDLVFFLRVHEADDVAFLHLSVKNSGVYYYAFVVVVF